MNRTRAELSLEYYFIYMSLYLIITSPIFVGPHSLNGLQRWLKVEPTCLERERERERESTRNSTGPKMRIVLKRVMYESERNPPSNANAQDMPMKLVTLVEAVPTPICITFCRYVTTLIIVDTNDMFNATTRAAIFT